MTKKAISALIGLLLSACSLPQTTPTSFPTQALIFPTVVLATPALVTPTPSLPTAVFVTMPPTSVGVATASSPGITGGVTQVPPATFCADTAPTALIASLQAALQASNGPALAALVNPVSGMEVRRFRDGRLVTYDQAHAKFLFESTFQVKWGPAPGSGLETVGAFHEVILPAWRKVFNTSYTLACNQLQVGGTTYTAEWPYPGINYYSLHYPGTSANGNMDWQTLVIGMQNVNGKYYIHSVMQFEWEI